jgi:hypothetical protein
MSFAPPTVPFGTTKPLTRFFRKCADNEMSW